MNSQQQQLNTQKMQSRHYQQVPQQNSQSRGGSAHQQQPNPQIPRPPLSGIHVPEDYDAQDQTQKEKFFESLGLPPNLSDLSIQKYHQQQNQSNQKVRQSDEVNSMSGMPQQHYMQNAPGGSDNHSLMFKSAHQASGGNLTAMQGGYSNMKFQQQQQPNHHTSFKTANNMGNNGQSNGAAILSDSSFLTAFDAQQSISQHQLTPGGGSSGQVVQNGRVPPRFIHDPTNQMNNGSSIGQKQYNQDPLSASAHFPSKHTDSITGVMPGIASNGQYQGDDEMRKFEDLFIDSQRKHSAPVGGNMKASNDNTLNPFTSGLPSTAAIDSAQPSGARFQAVPNSMVPQPPSFNNTVHSIQPYTQHFQPTTSHQPLTNSQLGENKFLNSNGGGNVDRNPSSSSRDSQQLSSQRREILTITVDIGNENGEQANIVIREGDDPHILAAEFAERHGISSEQLRELLAEQIQINMEAVLREEEEIAMQERQNVLSGAGSLNDKIPRYYEEASGIAMTSPGLEMLSGADGSSMDNRLPQKGYDPYNGGSSQNLLAKHSSGNLLLNAATGSDQTQLTHSGRPHHPFNNQNQQYPGVNQDSSSMLLMRHSAQSSTTNTQNPQTYGGTGTNQQQMTINSTVDQMYQNHVALQQRDGLDNSQINQSYNHYLLKQSLQNHRAGSYGKLQSLVNQSFVSEGVNNSSALYQYPGTQTYQQWKDQVAAQLKNQKTNHPAINDNSRKIIEHKRLLNNSGNGSSRKNSGSVHQRLHQQAVSKQRHIQNNFLPPRNQNSNGLGNSQINILSNGGGSTKNINRKVFNLNGSNQSSPTRGGYFQEREAHNNPPRSSSAQEGHHSNHSSTLKPPIPVINYGERLYQKGLKRKEEQYRLLNQVRQQQEQESLAQNCSFQPQINEISKAIVNREGLRTEDVLIKYGQQARERIEQKRSAMLFKEISECRFRPQIAKYTERILSRQQMNQLNQNGYESDGVINEGRNQGYQWRQSSADRMRNSNSADKFSDLYKDAMRRRERQEKIYSACIGAEYTFQPDLTVSKYYYQRLESRDPGYQQHKQQQMLNNSDYRTHQQPSQQRQGGNNYHHIRNLSEGISEKERLQRSLKKSSTFSNELCDPDSGIPYFRPRVGRGPRNQHRPDPNKEKGATAAMLYNQSKVIREKIEFKKRMLEQENEVNMKRVHTIDKSKYIIEELKISHFSDIFRRLDSDADGNISCQRIDLSLIEPEILGVLEQIFTEMEELGQSLTEEEFIDATCRLYDALPVPQKRLLFNPKEHINHRRGVKQITQANLHKPKLDPNSVKIAQNKRPSNENVHEILYRKMKEYEQRIMEKKQEKENLELVGCTFHPNIIQSPMSQQSSGMKAYPRHIGAQPNFGGANSTLPGSRQSLNGGQSTMTGSQMRQPQITNLSQNQPQLNVNHSQSFHGNQSQHTATFNNYRELNNQSIGGGIGGGNGPTHNATFDLNTLALNVAQEYLRPKITQLAGLDGVASQINRPPSVGGGSISGGGGSLQMPMPSAPIPHPSQPNPALLGRQGNNGGFNQPILQQKYGQRAYNSGQHHNY